MKVTRRDRYFTIMLVPEGRQGVYRWVLTTWFLKALVVIAVAILIALGGAIGMASHLQKRVVQLHHIEQQNSIQRKQIDWLEEQARLMELKIQEVDELDREVRNMLGLEQGGGQRPSEASRSGRGTRQPEQKLKQVQSTLAAVEEAASVQEERLKSLAKEVQEHLNYQAALPSRWPLMGPVSSFFGNRVSPFGRRQEFHNGIDIAAPYGAEVRAAGSGRVIFAGYQAGYGYTVIIDHGYGLTSSYSHNSKLLVKTGDEVVGGQVISRVGNSGRSTGPHLHFGIMLNNEAVDPLYYLEGEKAGHVQEKKQQR
ncbi:MAG TPA: peptidoglycan DD-metalloendopeptidase family protein [Firmicutes bacterium]|nr:peptidoglycan DD-metalloendopeptidase family protein [Bacillota bacterium]